MVGFLLNSQPFSCPEKSADEKKPAEAIDHAGSGGFEPSNQPFKEAHGPSLANCLQIRTVAS